MYIHVQVYMYTYIYIYIYTYVYINRSRDRFVSPRTLQGSPRRPVWNLSVAPKDDALGLKNAFLKMGPCFDVLTLERIWWQRCKKNNWGSPGHMGPHGQGIPRGSPGMPRGPLGIKRETCRAPKDRPQTALSCISRERMRSRDPASHGGEPLQTL